MRLAYRIRKTGRKDDYLILVIVGLLTILGLAMLASASFDMDKIKIGDTYYHLRHQVLYGLSIGIAGFMVASRTYYRLWEKLSVPLLIIGILGLLLTFSPLAVKANGASRWIELKGLSIQPAEILKLAFVVYLAALFGKKSSMTPRNEIRQKFLPFLIVSGLVGGLLFAQPSTGTAVIILGSGLIMYLASGARFRYVLLTVLIGLAVFGTIIYVTPYRFERVRSFLAPTSDLQKSNYQLNQSMMAIGSGGFWGVGFGRSTAKYKFLPEPIGDSIFAVVAEELGFLGAITLIGLFAILVIRYLIISRRSGDKFAELLIVGFASLITIQTFLHIGSNSGLLPLTGVPLPFISYGGTSLAVFLIMAGIVRNISRYT